jgi:biopolymer transport protein ExbB/TolQ
VHTTNPAVAAPGIAQLLATALGLPAAIPAVVIYNVFARSTGPIALGSAMQGQRWFLVYST